MSCCYCIAALARVLGFFWWKFFIFLFTVLLGLTKSIEDWYCEQQTVKQNIWLFSFLLPCNIINLTLKYQLIAHYFNTLCKTYAKIRRSNPTRFNPKGSSLGSKCSYLWSYWIFLIFVDIIGVVAACL